MNNHLKYHYRQIICYDFLIKLNITNLFEIPNIQKIYLNIGFKKASTDKKKLINFFLLLKLISNQEPLPTKSKKNNLFLKIKKNSIVGCKIMLKKKEVFFFLEKLFFFIFPSSKKTINSFQKNKIINFQIKNSLHFFELKQEFLKFKKIPPIDVCIHVYASKNIYINLLLNYFYIN